MPENYYTILGCSETASYEELKRNYQQLVKQYHPDKQSIEPHDQFLKIDEAWKILRDTELRRKYDASLAQNEIHEEYLVYANLSINELDFDDNFLSLYPCRCGNSYLIDKKLIDEQCVIECEECSYVIIVNNNKID